jgi:hypothetical protein
MPSIIQDSHFSGEPKNRYCGLLAGIWTIWLVAVFSVYRIAFMLAKLTVKCSCLGLIGVLIGSDKLSESVIAITILMLLFIAGLVLILIAIQTGVKKPVNWTAGILLISTAVAAEGASLPYEIEGIIHTEYYSALGKSSGNGDSLFRLRIDGNKWELRTSKPGSDDYCITSDGHTNYSVIVASDTNFYSDAAFVDNWPIPLNRPSENLPIWVFLPKRSDEQIWKSLPTPWGLPKSFPQSYFAEAEFEWRDLEGDVFSKIKFVYSRDRVRKSLGAPYLTKGIPQQVKQDELEVIASNMETNLIAGSLTIVSYLTNKFGVIPREFSMTVYSSLVARLNKTNTFPISVYSGRVEQVNSCLPVEFPPSPKKQITVVDYRFRDIDNNIDHYIYGPVKEWIAEKEEVLKQSNVRIVKFQEIGDDKPVASKFFFITICILLIFPFLIWRFAKRAHIETSAKP